MLYLAIKTGLSGIIIALGSEVARRHTRAISRNNNKPRQKRARDMSALLLHSCGNGASVRIASQQPR
ncbi:MAG: hypothetical protein P8Z80_20770 [Pseudolabrys sp.]